LTDLYSFPLNRFPAALAALLPNTLAPTLIGRAARLLETDDGEESYAGGMGGSIGTGRGFTGVRGIEKLDELLLAAANPGKE
jgi:hypothetical protein